MAKKKPRVLPVGKQGEFRLPLDALEAIGWEAGDAVEIRIDTRRRQIQLERHVEDAWAEALKEKPAKGFEDLAKDQEQREAEAKDLFERRIRDAKPGQRSKEDDPGRWR